eukprot:TRINITY_DN1038_c3_g1_i1.p1 TRINITY_DN1038_c3_g1~~TRINITY_DN1038_c3_g1_i1.p1  ORF type:complete len:206 (-),score=72.29 TRINITY_DN1038_c3_g1_i1:122-739(-)
MKKNNLYFIFIIVVLSLLKFIENSSQIKVYEVKTKISTLSESLDRGELQFKSNLLGEPKLYQNELNSNQISSIIKAVNEDSNALYQVMLISEKTQLLAFEQLKKLVCNNFNDEMILHFTTNGDLIAFSYFASNSDIKDCVINQDTQWEWETKVLVSKPTAGPVPFEVEEVVQQQNQSFFSKYWMWIVGGFIIMQLLGTVFKAPAS